MRRGNLFGGFLLLLIGALLLLSNLGYLDVDVWNLLWPVFLIALGLWILWGVVLGPSVVEAEEVTTPLEGADRAHVRVRHGAGRLRVGAGAGPGELMSGTFGGGLECRTKLEGGGLTLDMRMPVGGFPHVFAPWNWGRVGSLGWSLGLSGEIPLTLDVETGASEARLDLSALHVTDLQLKTGASSTDVTLPVNAGHTRVDVEAGAASVTIRVPSSVAARVQFEGGLASINIDRNRFPLVGDVYQSSNYGTAANKVDIDIEAGVGSVSVR